MKRRSKLIVAAALGLLYLLLAPVFMLGARIPPSEEDYPEIGADARAYLWVTTKPAFRYFVLFGVRRRDLMPKTHFIVRDTDQGLESLRVSHAVVVVDGMSNVVTALIEQAHMFGKSIHNMHGGNGGMCKITFEMPAIPAQELQISIKGTAMRSSGDEHPFIYVKTASVIRSRSVWPMILYALKDLIYSSM